MTNLAHWQDEIDDALGGDFDGSLSGLCIMSLSFDFSRNSAGPQLGSSRENNHNQVNNNTLTVGNNHSNGILSVATSSANKSINYGINLNHDAQNDSSPNCFKRFKPSLTSDQLGTDDEISKSNNQNKIVRQLQQIKNCLSTTSLANTNQSGVTTVANYVTAASKSLGQVEADCDLELNRQSPNSPEGSCNRVSDSPSPSESVRSSTVDARSPSPSQSCSSISTHSPDSSRSQSPSDMSLHSCNNNNDKANNNNDQQRNNLGASSHLNQQTNKNNPNQNEPKGQVSDNENPQISSYSVKDSIINGGTFKESSYTTSVITTTAPMHFKSLHHPFSLKQFPLSPYHQFSNSSLNHDFYDRYLSHDSHQPLQTPLIGLDRTQDLLSLRLPPHGPEETDSQRFPKEWPFDADTKNDMDTANVGAKTNQNSSEKLRTNDVQPDKINLGHPRTTGGDGANKRKDLCAENNNSEPHKGFQFSYKGSSSSPSVAQDRTGRADQHEPIDLNVSYHQQEDCCNDEAKDSIFNESMKHFNPDRVQQNACYDLRSNKNNLSSNQNGNHHGNDGHDNSTNLAHQYHGQESMFGIDSSKQKFKNILAAPISVATKLNEDTMTYLNQGQAYEIKLENITDIAEVKKGFMCSIINIGFHERHMQQAENELWQQWSQQHPDEKIFSVDMKLSYNVFGVESDGLNKYEFLWDSSKAAGVFIRINSISTEFTPKKHGGEKGVPFKLSIETFSYNSKTHDSYFISASCCQIKVFKPKGAERKIRSDRDKISKRPICEQERYHRPSDHTNFTECSLSSLHPMADGSLCYYRHSHGHFASKQVIMTSGASHPAQHAHQSSTHAQPGEEMVDTANNNGSQQNQSPEEHSSDQNRQGPMSNNDSETSSNGQSSGSHQRDYQSGLSARSVPINDKILHQNDHYLAPSRPMPRHVDQQHNTDNDENNMDHGPDHHYGPQHNQTNHHHDQNFNSHSNNLTQLQQPNTFNQIYHGGQARSVASLAGINTSQHFNMSYYGHALPAPTAPHIPPPTSYGAPTSTASNAIPISHHGISPPVTQHNIPKGASSIYRQLNQGKSINSTGQTSNAGCFKASSLALSSAHHNFQTYPCIQTEHCAVDVPIHEVKAEGSYQHDNNYNTHLPLPFNSHNSQSIRQRSASTSLTTATSNNHCSGYFGAQANSNRHLAESYISSNHTNNLSEVPMSLGNHWAQNGPSNTSQSASPHSYCGLRTMNGGGRANAIPDQNPDDHSFNGNNTGHNYDNCNHPQTYKSPHKNQNHASDSSSSCYSRFRNGSSVLNSNLQQNNQFESNLRANQTHRIHITANSSCTELATWFTVNRFGLFAKTFNNFSGSDLLRLSKAELIEICGLIDGIRLYNCLHDRPIKPRRILYVCYNNSEVFHPIYLYDVTLKELLGELSMIFAHQIRHSRLTEDNQNHNQTSPNQKSTLASNSSNDSRSSMGALSIETGADDVAFTQTDNFFNIVEIQAKKEKYQSAGTLKMTDILNHPSQITIIDRLLIDGITTVKIVATEQVLQILEDESVWNFSLVSNGSGSSLVEACISAYRSKLRTTK